MRKILSYIFFSLSIVIWLIAVSPIVLIIRLIDAILNLITKKS